MGMHALVVAMSGEADNRAKRSPRERGGDEGAVLRLQRAQRRPDVGDPIERNEMRGSASKAIARLATGQKGSISRSQLLANGLRRSTITRRAARGELHRMHRGIYLVGHEALAPLAREWAAVLACGQGTVVSHHSAAQAWSLLEDRDCEDVEVTVLGRRIRSRPGLRIHRTERLQAADIRRIDGLPITAPARTLLDLAAVGCERLERAFSEAHVRRLLTDRAMEGALRRAGRRRGVLAIKALIDANELGFARSEAERRMRNLILRAGLPAPLLNTRVAGYLVDFVWPRQRLIVEVDGYRFHGHRVAFERDRRKSMALVAAGYRVIRVTWRQLTREHLAVVATIASALAEAEVGGRGQG